MDHHTHADTAQKRPAQDRPVHGVIDPVCGMTVDPNVTAHRLTHQGRPY
jgi:Cu+-exporting ATPase